MEPEEDQYQIQENQTLLQRIKNNKKILIVAGVVIVLLIISLVIWMILLRNEEITEQTQTAQRFSSQNQIPESLIYFSTPVFDFDSYPNPNEDSVAVDLLFKLQRNASAEIITTLAFDPNSLNEVEFAPSNNVTVNQNQVDQQTGQINLSLTINSQINANEEFKLGSIVFSPAISNQNNTRINPILEETRITSNNEVLESGVANIEILLPSENANNTQTVPEGAEEQLQQQNDILQQSQQ